MVLTLSNYSTSDLVLSDINLTIAGGSTHSVDTNELNGVFKDGSLLYNMIINSIPVSRISYGSGFKVLIGSTELSQSAAALALKGGLARDILVEASGKSVEELVSAIELKASAFALTTVADIDSKASMEALVSVSDRVTAIEQDLAVTDSSEISAIIGADVSTSLTNEFNYNSQLDFNWSRSGADRDPKTILSAVNANRKDLWEFVELLSTQGAYAGVAAGANLIGCDGIPGVVPKGKTDGANGNLQQMLEGVKDQLVASIGVSNTASATANAAKNTADATAAILNSGILGVVSYENTTDKKGIGISAGVTLDIAASAGSTSYVGPKDGSIYYDTNIGELMAYDATRAKWISVCKKTFTFGSASVDNHYLYTSSSNINGAITGYLIPRAAVITAATIKVGGGTIDKHYHIRRNGSSTEDLNTMNVTTVAGGKLSLTNLNINLNAGDYIQIFASEDGNYAQNVVAVLDVAYRA